MIIQILSDLKEEGYLASARHPTAAPFFAGANSAFRREALQQVGDFDPECVTGEDCDICARVSAAGWGLYLRSGAVVRHNNPTTFGQVARQWYGYGRHHPYVFAKHNDPAVEVHARLGRPVAGERYALLFYRRFPLRAVLFVTTFLCTHVSLAASALMLLLGLPALALAGGALTAGLALAYSWPDLKRSGPLTGLAYSAVRYAADLSLFAGALVGGFRRGMLYISPTVD